jgi:hypothetical protein
MRSELVGTLFSWAWDKILTPDVDRQVEEAEPTKAWIAKIVCFRLGENGPRLL